LLFEYIFIIWWFCQKHNEPSISILLHSCTILLRISRSVQNSSRLSYLTLDIIDFIGAKFLINKRVWLKSCLLDFIIHLVTVLYMYSFGAICTHSCVIFVYQFISSSNAHQLKCCAACEVLFQAFHRSIPCYSEHITSSISHALWRFTSHLQSSHSFHLWIWLELTMCTLFLIRYSIALFVTFWSCYALKSRLIHWNLFPCFRKCQHCFHLHSLSTLHNTLTLFLLASTNVFKS